MNAGSMSTRKRIFPGLHIAVALSAWCTAAMWMFASWSVRQDITQEMIAALNRRYAHGISITIIREGEGPSTWQGRLLWRNRLTAIWCGLAVLYTLRAVRLCDVHCRQAAAERVE